MKRLWGPAAFAFVAVACGGKITGGDGGDAGTKDDATNVTCCPPSAQPSCCMSYGGAAEGNACATVCDGMPSPSDPGWHLGSDSNGCKVWIPPPNPTSFCGEPPPPDSGPPGCAPTLGPWSPEIDPPFFSHANVCTFQQINDVYAYCFSSNVNATQCQSTLSQDAACAACLITPDTASKWGAVLARADGIFDVDLPGCIAIETGDVACAQHASDLRQCEIASCASCSPPADQQSFTDWQTCLDAADQTTCAKYAAADCTDADAGAAACVPGDFKDAYFTFANLFCGP